MMYRKCCMIMLILTFHIALLSILWTMRQSNEDRHYGWKTKESSDSQRTQESSSSNQPPNLLFIVLDQLRYDTVGFMQHKLPIYKDKLKIRTPNIDRIAALGTSFTTAYCASPSCGPARASIKTGNTVMRTGMTGNKLVKSESYELMS